jgi:hypothetical protein
MDSASLVSTMRHFGTKKNAKKCKKMCTFPESHGIIYL